jgi:hypothetical protein
MIAIIATIGSSKNSSCCWTDHRADVMMVMPVLSLMSHGFAIEVDGRRSR